MQRQVGRIHTLHSVTATVTGCTTRTECTETSMVRSGVESVETTVTDNPRHTLLLCVHDGPITSMLDAKSPPPDDCPRIELSSNVRIVHAGLCCE